MHQKIQSGLSPGKENCREGQRIKIEESSYADGTKYILDCCPFDSNHKGKDACIFQSRNGAIGFHCFHNSCADKKWQDVRLLYEPDAYEQKNQRYEQDIYGGWRKFGQKIEKDNLDLLILDNLMAFNISDLAEKKYEAQTEFVLSLQQLAKRKNVHILFVAHPRRALGFLRLDDISGTADLANAVDNAFIVHRVNEDFKRLSKAMFGWKDNRDVYSATIKSQRTAQRSFGKESSGQDMSQCWNT